MPKWFAWEKGSIFARLRLVDRGVLHVCGVGGTLFCFDDCLEMDNMCCCVSVCGKMIHNYDIKIGNGQNWGTMY